MNDANQQSSGSKVFVLLIAVVVWGNSCSDEQNMNDPGLQDGNLQVTAATTGENLDPDGYTVTVDGTNSQSIGINGSVTFTGLAAGDHPVELSGVASNCTVSGANPRTVTVTAGGTATTSFGVSCSAQTGDLQVSTSTTGEDLDPDGYTVTLDGSSSQSIGLNQSVTFSDLAAGDHPVELSGVASNCSVSGANPRTVTVTTGATATTTFDVVCASSGLPYPPSPVIADITFDFSTHDRRAPGSDNWPITWADDGHQYSSWGDGGGFGGTNSDGRVSLGVARIEGTATSYAGFNVWGGSNPENPATFGGKSYGIISVDGVLYMWVSPGSNVTNYSEARVYSSTNHGASWTGASWTFTQSQGLVLPTFVQFGRDYQGARDAYVYIYAINLKDASALKVQKPGEIVLLRVPKDQITSRSSYEFFAGLDSSNNPTWSSDVGSRVPVFEDPRGVGWNASGSFNPGLGRYFLTTEHDQTFGGNIGIFDAPEPWGPWTTVLYDSGFGAPTIEARSFFWNFSNKWLSADGLDFTLVFSGVGSNDAWNTVKGSLEPR